MRMRVPCPAAEKVTFCTRGDLRESHPTLRESVGFSKT